MLELSIKNLKASIRKTVQQTAADTFKTNIKIKVSSKETEEIKNEMEKYDKLNFLYQLTSWAQYQNGDNRGKNQ